MKMYFVNRESMDVPHRTDLVRPAITGKYGNYCKSKYGSNESEKVMLSNGWTLEPLSKSEFLELKKLESDREAKLRIETHNQKLKDRRDQVEICLKSDPVPVIPNEGENPFVSMVANLSKSKMIDAYYGEGKGTAYLNEEGCVIAFHYGYDKPENAPKVGGVRVSLSCTQICFS